MGCRQSRSINSSPAILKKKSRTSFHSHISTLKLHKEDKQKRTKKLLEDLTHKVETHPKSAEYTYKLGTLYAVMGSPNEAQPFLEKAVELYKETKKGDSSFSSNEFYCNLILQQVVWANHVSNDELKPIEDELARLKQEAIQNFGEQSPEVAIVQSQKIRTCLIKNDGQTLQELSDAALILYEKRHEYPIYCYQAYDHLANIYINNFKFAKSLDLQEKASLNSDKALEVFMFLLEEGFKLKPKDYYQELVIEDHLEELIKQFTKICKLILQILEDDQKDWKNAKEDEQKFNLAYCKASVAEVQFYEKEKFIMDQFFPKLNPAHKIDILYKRMEAEALYASKEGQMKVKAQYLTDVAFCYYQCEEYEKGIKEAEQNISLCQQIGNMELLLENNVIKGNCFLKQDQAKKAQTTFSNGVVIMEDAKVSKEKEIEVYFGLAQAFDMQGFRVEAQENYQKVITELRNKHPRFDEIKKAANKFYNMVNQDNSKNDISVQSLNRSNQK